MICANNVDFGNNKRMIVYAVGGNNRGVGSILDQDMKKCDLGYCQHNERIFVLTLNGNILSIYIIVFYAPAK